GENITVSNGICYQVGDVFPDENTKYWWKLNISDGNGGYSEETYYFTTEAAKQWIILDTWNITLGNLTISPYTLDTWNVTLGNLTITSFTIDTWNLTIGNLTISPFTRTD
ncbi:unnamed protein product, partial [marine sediment metagenome]